MKRFSTLALFSLFFAGTLQAQMPVLKVSAASNQQAVSLQKLDIDVQIVGNLAKTVMTMRFYNSGDRVLEGELTFPMPEGVSISSYALDLDGKMRDAVPVEKAKATAVFESIERRKVDPGLLEKIEGNNFRTRIYPIPVKGFRTITIGYEEELKFDQQRALRYHLPLAYASAIASFSLKTTIFENRINPQLVEQPDGSFTLKRTNNAFIGVMKKENFQPKLGLTISLPKPTELPEVQLQKAENGYFFLVNIFPKTQNRTRELGNTIGLIWDCSLSGLQRDVKKELDLLERLITKKQNLTINLGMLNNTLNNAGSFVIENGDWSSLKKRLKSVVYDGGTNFSAINDQTFVANEYLFFTDGLSSFGSDAIALTKPVHTITTSLRADYSILKYISGKTGGQFINLNLLSPTNALKRLSEEPLRFMGIKNAADVRETYPSVPVNVDGNLSLAGILSRYSTSVTLQFGYGKTVTSEQTISLTADNLPLNGIEIGKIWAQKKIAEMDIHYDRNRREISEVGKQFGIVTRNTSLIVLESLEDYLRYAIIPPPELRLAYDSVINERKNELVEKRKDLLEEAVAMSNDLKAWYMTDFALFKAKKKSQAPPVREMTSVQELKSDGNASSTVLFSPPPVSSASPGDKDEKLMNEAVVVAYSNLLGGKTSGIQIATDKSIGEIIIPDFKSDKAYMDSIRGDAGEAYRKYLILRPRYLTTPMFYFDVASYFFKIGDFPKGLMILSNIADLELENAELYKLMAYKLKQEGNYKDALFVTEKVLQWRPMDPQSYRDYALAKAEIGEYQQALNYLYKVLTQTYNEDSQDRDQGIEEIIVTEINGLITRHGKKLNLSGIDKRIIQPLSVDIRVVLSWNKKDTDMDLWLTDPKGEKCFYSHPTTAIGGRLSNDFTEGYGPEQFMLKKAIAGKYKIEVDFYGETQATISGPTTVTAEIFTQYAGGKQQRKIIIVPLASAHSGSKKIGEFVF